MKTAFWQASLTASQAGENSQINGLEHAIESSILTVLILSKGTDLGCCRLLQRFLQLQSEKQHMDCDQRFWLGPLSAPHAQPCLNARRSALPLLRIHPELHQGRPILGR
jgi:hypothetical protein